MRRLCRYCKTMKSFGDEGSSYCGMTKGDNTAKKCKYFNYFEVKIYKVTAKHIEYLCSKYIRAENKNEAKELFKTCFDNGEVQVGASEIKYQEVKEVIEDAKLV